MLKALAALALALTPAQPTALLGSGQSQPEDRLWSQAPGNDGWWVQRPPVRFAKGVGTALVIYDTPAEVEAICGIAGALACAIPAGVIHALPVIVMPDPCGFGAERYGQLACHETSHAFGGWRHERA
jgi:hypothetical protein